MAEQERPIRFVCPRCKNPMQASAADAGTVMTCSGCGQKLQIPKPKPPQGIAAAADVPRLCAQRPAAAGSRYVGRTGAAAKARAARA